MVAIEYFLIKIKPTAKLFQDKSVDISKAKNSLDNIVQFMNRLDRNFLAKDLVEQANAISKNFDLFGGYLGSRTYITPYEYCANKFIEPIITRFLEVVKCKISTSEIEIISMFQAFIKGDCANEALQTTIKYKIVIDKGAEHSFFLSKLLKKRLMKFLI